jgi:hypothetical protein
MTACGRRKKNQCPTYAKQSELYASMALMGRARPPGEPEQVTARKLLDKERSSLCALPKVGLAHNPKKSTTDYTDVSRRSRRDEAG